jgi:quercetin dioxygenase-like cupin family protein
MIVVEATAQMDISQVVTSRTETGGRSMAIDDRAEDASTANSDVWSGLIPDPGSPGFSVRGTYPSTSDGVEVMLERWDAGTEEPPHYHPGDDMTIVVEGKMVVQFYRRVGESLVPDGGPIQLNKGDVGYVRAERVHDAKYVENCQLVYVHNGAFAFNRVDLAVA